jgi:hypothetical protein
VSAEAYGGNQFHRKDVMKKPNALKLGGSILAGILLIISLGLNLGLLFAGPGRRVETRPPSSAGSDPVTRKGDEQLAYVLVKLELQTRREIAGHFTRKQSAFPGVTKLYQRLMVRNLILPAAVADSIFAETVPRATGGRAWVKMVVDQPRNPNNRGDEAALDLLTELRQGAPTAERKTTDAYYYAEPIKAAAGCLYCHGDPKGAPDPYFPQFTKDGWKDGEIVGAVVARVAPGAAEAP